MLYIICEKYDITENLMSHLKNKYSDISIIEMPVIQFNFGQNLLYRLLNRFNTTFLFEILFSNKILDSLKVINQNDKIIFWDYYFYLEIKYILKNINIPKSSVYIWIWNTLNKGHLKKLHLFKNLAINIYTFDPDDAKKYNLHYLNQVHYKTNVINNKILYDFFFIGLDKGRGSILERLAEEIKKEGFTSNFIILKLNESDIHYKHINIIERSISYNKTLELIAQSRVLVDITQEGQTGITLRTLEAAFYEKKLLTNNHHIKNLDIYEPQNMLIMDNDFIFINKLKEFIQSDLKPYNKKCLEKYYIENWIKHFL